MPSKIVIHTSDYTREWIVKNYNAYLKTEHWQTVKRIYSEHHPKSSKCVACRKKTHLNLHHRSYEHVGNEWFSDLCYLCYDCHQRAHQMLRSGKYDWLTLKNVDRKLQRKAKRVVRKNGFRCQVCGQGGFADTLGRCLCEKHTTEYKGVMLPEQYRGNFNKRKHLERLKNEIRR